MTTNITTGAQGPSGPAGAAGATGAAGGLPLISSGTISSPAAAVDITLPAGYFRFILDFAGLIVSSNDTLAAAFSANGGSTFLNDAVNNDSYAWRELYVATTPFLQTLGRSNSLLLLSSGDGNTNNVMDGTFSIWPGSAAAFATFRGSELDFNQVADVTNDTVIFIGGGVNPVATVPPTKQRINLLRLRAQGDGNELTAGSWALFGVPTP